ncbi:MAG TPA: hypothetical protein PKY56_13415, partial [Candidatus Kapabacteria bacterium]|nr:hypothetical protein [Candidatus Kapabacteria bacterium]
VANNLKSLGIDSYLCGILATDNSQLYYIIKSGMQTWDIKKAELIKEYEFKENETQYSFLGVVKPKNQDYFVGLASSKNEPNIYKIITWDVDSFKIKNSFNIDIENLMLHSLEISPDGSYLIVRLKDSIVWDSKYSTRNKIYNLNNNSLIKELNQNIYTAVFTDDYFAYFNTNKVVICSIGDFNVVQEVSCSKSKHDYSNQFDMLNDGKYLLYINKENLEQLDIYNIEKKEVEYSINPKTSKNSFYNFVNKDTVLIAIIQDYYNNDPIAEIIDCKTNSFITQIFNANVMVDDFYFSNDNKYLYSISAGGYFSIYEVETGKLISSTLEFTNLLIPYNYTRLEINKQNSMLAWAGGVDCIYIIDLINQNKLLYSISKSNAKLISPSFSSDSKSMLCADAYYHLVMLWDLENKVLKDTLKTNGPTLLTFFSEDDNYVYVLSKPEITMNTILYKWNQLTGEVTSKTIAFYPYENDNCYVSKDKKFISCDNAVYDIENEITHSISVDMRIKANSLANNSHYIAVSRTDGFSANDDAMFKVIDWTNNKVIKEYKILDYISCSESIKLFFRYSRAVKFSPNNQYIAASTEYGDIALFKFDTTSSAVEAYPETNTYEAKVFPNPASNIVNLDLSLPVSGVVN